MIDYTKLDIRKLRGRGPEGYHVYDTLNDQLILKVMMDWGKTPDGNRIQIFDVRTGESILRKSIPKRSFNVSNLTEVVFNVIDSMTCEVCHHEWGPVCVGCTEDAADKTFLLFKDLQRMADS